MKISCIPNFCPGLKFIAIWECLVQEVGTNWWVHPVPALSNSLQNTGITHACNAVIVTQTMPIYTVRTCTYVLKCIYRQYVCAGSQQIQRSCPLSTVGGRTTQYLAARGPNKVQAKDTNYQLSRPLWSLLQIINSISSTSVNNYMYYAHAVTDK